jgi:hypothetical protein
MHPLYKASYALEVFSQSCENFEQYPHNLIAHDALRHTLQAYHTRLDSRSARLFDEHKADVDFWELKSGVPGNFSCKIIRAMLTRP